MGTPSTKKCYQKMGSTVQLFNMSMLCFTTLQKLNAFKGCMS